MIEGGVLKLKLVLTLLMLTTIYLAYEKYIKPKTQNNKGNEMMGKKGKGIAEFGVWIIVGVVALLIILWLLGVIRF